MAWDKATYGGSDKKRGGGKLESPANEGNKGWTGSKPGNSSVGRKLIDTGMTSGDKGIPPRTSGGTSKAPKD